MPWLVCAAHASAGAEGVRGKNLRQYRHHWMEETSMHIVRPPPLPPACAFLVRIALPRCRSRCSTRLGRMPTSACECAFPAYRCCCERSGGQTGDDDCTGMVRSIDHQQVSVNDTPRLLLEGSHKIIFRLQNIFRVCRVKLIGGEDEDAVLVTGEQTFKLTKAETSNTLLLVPPEGTNGSGGTLSRCGVNSGRGREGGGGASGARGFEAVAAVGCQFEVGGVA